LTSAGNNSTGVLKDVRAGGGSGLGAEAAAWFLVIGALTQA
jgi:hypothetical protein